MSPGGWGTAGRCWRPLPRVLRAALGRLLPHLPAAASPRPPPPRPPPGCRPLPGITAPSPSSSVSTTSFSLSFGFQVQRAAFETPSQTSPHRRVPPPAWPFAVSVPLLSVCCVPVSIIHSRFLTRVLSPRLRNSVRKGMASVLFTVTSPEPEPQKVPNSIDCSSHVQDSLACCWGPSRGIRRHQRLVGRKRSSRWAGERCPRGREPGAQLSGVGGACENRRTCEPRSLGPRAEGLAPLARQQRQDCRGSWL